MTGTLRSSLRSPHKLRFIVFTLCLIALASAPRTSHAADGEPHPTPEEQVLLDQYPSYNQIIEVIQANAQNGVHDFLEANVGKTIYLDTAILAYAPIPPVITEEIKAKLATDRFENEVMQKCWTEPGDWYGYTNVGPLGFPLPKDEPDIEAGCASRLRLDFVYGDSSPGLEVRKGSNQIELIFTGFFDVVKAEPQPGTTLYTLTQKPMDDETIRVFAQFRPTPARPERPLWLDQ